MSEVINAIVESGADLVYFPLFAPEAVLLAQQAADYPGLEDTIMMTADAAFSTYFAENRRRSGHRHLCGRSIRLRRRIRCLRRNLEARDRRGGTHRRLPRPRV